MCGIYTLFSLYLKNATPEARGRILATIQGYSKFLSGRGPETRRSEEIDGSVFMEFYRLAIVGVAKGMQPFHLDEAFPNLHLICNGEIYNHLELEALIGYESVTGSDCEVILPLFAQFGFQSMLQLLDGVFAVSLFDSSTQTLWTGRDRFGVRPLHICIEKDGEDRIQAVQVASELKSICPLAHHLEESRRLAVTQVPPGTYRAYRLKESEIIEELEERYFVHSWANNSTMLFEEALTGINRLLTEAVHKRMMSERPIGCLLSGGLDSSLVAALVGREMKRRGRPLHTFSIGMPQSTDLYFARQVADHIGSIHHEFLLTPAEFLEAIDEVVWIIESWDTTSVRASVGNYLVCKRITQRNKAVAAPDQAIVIFNGDGADELCGGYLYHHRRSPTPVDFHLEAQRLLSRLYMYDVLRSDRSISSNGLEARTPFLDQNFVAFYMSIPLAFRADKSRQEKWLVREAFKDSGLLPDSVLLRAKEAFSDGVSGTQTSWWQIIHNWIEPKISDQDLEKAKGFYTDPVTSASKEALYFMKKFEEFYPGQRPIIDGYWLPRWSGNITNPSARVLSEYSTQAQEKAATTDPTIGKTENIPVPESLIEKKQEEKSI